MPDDVKNGADAPQKDAASGAKPPDAPKPETAEVETLAQALERISKLEKRLSEANHEAAQRKRAKREAEEAARTAEEARLKEAGKSQELADRYAQELEKLRPLAEKASAYEEAFLATLSKRLDALPDVWKPVVPDFGDPVKTMAWLDANENKFQQRRAPDIDAGAGNIPNAKGGQPLTNLELELAKSFQMTPEEYLKFKAKGNAVKPLPDKKE